MFNEQLAKAGERSIPLTLLILLLVFGALVAAGVPLLLALSAVLATIGLVALPSHLVPMDPNVSAVVLLVGLAVGVDYSLFYIKREREERAAGQRPPRRARGRRRDVGPLGAHLRPDRDDRDGRDAASPATRRTCRSAIGTMMVVAVAMLGSLTVLPGAALEARRPRREGPHPVPRAGSGARAARTASGRRSSRRCSGTRSISAVALGGAAVALALPVLRMHTAQSGLDALPKSIADGRDDRQASRTRSRAAPTPASSRSRRTPTRRPTKARDRAARRRRRSRRGQMHGPIDGRRQRRRSTVARVAIPLAGNGTDAASNEALARRSATTILPATIGKVPGATYAVTGDDRQLGRRQRAAEALGAARVRLRARASRSCSCWSRSARS